MPCGSFCQAAELLQPLAAIGVCGRQTLALLPYGLGGSCISVFPVLSTGPGGNLQHKNQRPLEEDHSEGLCHFSQLFLFAVHLLLLLQLYNLGLPAGALVTLGSRR